MQASDAFGFSPVQPVLMTIFCVNKFLALYIDEQQIPTKSFKPTFETKPSLREYISFFSCTGQFLNMKEITFRVKSLMTTLCSGFKSGPERRLKMHFA